MATPNIARLKTLRAFLATRPDARTQLDRWHCGTQFCALGWATQIPEFQQAGLTLVEDSESSAYDYPQFGQNGVGLWAGATFFSISLHQSSYLFGPVRRREEPGYELGRVLPPDPVGLTAKEVALHRLDTLIAELETTHA